MNTRPATSTCTLAAGLGLLIFGAPCWSAGVWLPEDGGAAMGMAGAGRAALSLDATSMASNPAAMGGLTGTTFTAMAMPVDLETRFRGSDATPADASNREPANTIPGLYAVLRDDRLSYGLGVYSDFGLSFDLGNTWSGRRVVEQAGLGTLNIAPAVAYQATNRLTLGASIAAQLAQPDAQLAVANDAMFYGAPAGLPDGQIRLSGDSWGVGGQLGLLYQATNELRMGLAWSAPVDHSVPIDIHAHGLHPVLAMLLPADGVAKLDFTLPQQWLLGVSRQAPDGTIVAFGLSWQDWSAFGESKMRLPAQSSPMFASGLRDSWGAAAGVRHPVGSRWTVATGLNYESSPATSGGVPAYFPVAEQWRFAAGAEWAMSDVLRWRLELSVVQQGDAHVVQTSYPLPLPGIPPLTGRYQDTRVYAVAVAADFKR
jgi:long-chain fatty acid transport protein